MNGLVTEPSRIIAGQSGLIELDNATCQSPGLITPRGGLLMYQNSSAVSAGDYQTTHANQWNSATWFTATDYTNTRMRSGSGGATLLTVAGSNVDVRAESFADRQCWVFTNALRMLDISTSTTPCARLQGAPRGPGFVATQVNAAVAARVLSPQYGTAYRIVIARHITTSQGDRVVVGAPSDRVVIWNFTAGGVTSCNVQLLIPTANLAVGDEIQVYRAPLSVQWLTPGVVTDPGDELEMIHSYRLQAPASTYTWTDTAGDGSWSGPPLYTNKSQQDILQANERTRSANDVAYYNGMAFYGGASRGQSKTVTCRATTYNTSPVTTAAVAPENTLASMSFTCDTTIAGATLTNINFAASGAASVTNMVANGLSVGQLINVAANDPETAGNPKGRVVSWDTGLNTITIDANASASTVGTACICWDWVGTVTAAGVERLIYVSPPNMTTYPWSTASGVYVDSSVSVTAIARAFGAFDMERAWIFKYGTTALNAAVQRLYTVASSVYPYGDNVLMRWEWEDNAASPGDSIFTNPFEVISSKPFAFSQQLGRTYASNLARSENDGAAARVSWSKLLEPEATPLLNFTDIGDQSAPIVRLVATNDRLWIFKTDGLWSCYGTTPDTLTFQQVDPTCRLAKTSGTPGPTAAYSTAPLVSRLGNRVFAWTTTGIFSVSSAGVERVDQAIETDVRMWTTNYTGLIPGGGLWSAAGVYDDIVAFGLTNVRAVYPTNTSGITFVYHVGSGTWSTWSHINATTANLITGSGTSDAGNMVYGSRYGYGTYMDSPRDDYYATAYPLGTPFSPYRSDAFTGGGAGVYTCLTLSGNDVTYSTTATGFAIPFGAVVGQHPNYFSVIAVNGTTLTLDRAGLVAGVFDVLFPMRGTITYAATTQGAPAIYKRFQRAYFGFQHLRGALSFTDAYRIRGVVTGSTPVTEYLPNGTIATLPTAIGYTGDREFECMRDIPRDQTQGTGLETTLVMQQAGASYAIDALSVSYNPASTQLGGRS
jgi:hypothetical protein